MFFIKNMHKTIVIIGGRLSGLVSANICSHLGIDTVSLNKVIHWEKTINLKMIPSEIFLIMESRIR